MDSSNLITKEDVKKQLLELAKKANGNFHDAMSQHLSFLTTNYTKLDSEAKVIADKSFAAVGELVGESLEKMPDSIQKRQLKRKHAMAYGSHWDMQTVISALEKPTHLTESILVATNVR